MASDATAPLDQYLKPIKDHAHLIGAVTVAVTLLGVLASALVPTSYQATASVLVTPISTDPSETFESDVVVDMPTEQRIATSKTVVALVSQRLAQQSIDIDNDALAVNLSVSNPEESRILDVSYQAATPTLAQTGANTFAQTYLDYRSQLATENKSAIEEALQERITLLKDQLAGLEAELTGYEEGTQSFVTLSVERESIRSELNAQQETLAQLSTLSTDVGRIISPADPPERPRGLGPLVIVLGALAAGVVLGCLAAYVLAAITSAGVPRNRRITDRPDRTDPPDHTAGPARTPESESESHPVQASATRPSPPPPPRNNLLSSANPVAEPAHGAETHPEPLDTVTDTGPSAPGPEPRPEPTHRRAAAHENRAAVAQQQAMDAFFGPEPEPAEEPPSPDRHGDDEHRTVDPGDDGYRFESAWDTGFLDQDHRDQPGQPAVQEFPEPAELSIDPADYEPATVTAGAGSSEDSLDAVAAETSAVLVSLMNQVEPDVDPIRGFDSGESNPVPPVELQPLYEIGHVESEWQIDEDVENWAEQAAHAPVEAGFDVDPPPSYGPTVLSAPPALISEADFYPLLRRLGELGQDRSVTCVCLGEASRNASLAIGFGLADELQSLGINVLVVDMLLEEPALHRLLGLPARPGLLDILAGQATLAEGARGIAGLGPLRALTVGHEDDLADRRRTDELIRGWSMQRLLDDAGADFHATVIIGGTLDDARRLDLVLQQADGIVVGTEQMVGEPVHPELDIQLSELSAEVLALISIDAALPTSDPATSGAPSM